MAYSIFPYFLSFLRGYESHINHLKVIVAGKIVRTEQPRRKMTLEAQQSRKKKQKKKEEEDGTLSRIKRKCTCIFPASPEIRGKRKHVRNIFGPERPFSSAMRTKDSEPAYPGQQAGAEAGASGPHGVLLPWSFQDGFRIRRPRGRIEIVPTECSPPGPLSRAETISSRFVGSFIRSSRIEGSWLFKIDSAV